MIDSAKRLAKYSRYNASDKGQAREARRPGRLDYFRVYSAARRERLYQADMEHAQGCVVRTWEELELPGWQGRLARQVARDRIAAGRTGESLADMFEPHRVQEFEQRRASGWI